MIPGGSEPVQVENTYGGLPPDAVNCIGTIGEPTGVGVSTGTVMARVFGAALTLIVSGGVTAVAAAASVTLMEKMNAPVCVGVPDMRPVGDAKVSPGGSAPLVMVQL